MVKKSEKQEHKKKCPECDMSVERGDVYCSHCRTRLRFAFSKKELVLGSVILIILSILAVCSYYLFVFRTCQDLEGYICNKDECGAPFLKSKDSYCCPIPCGTCPEDVNCDDNDKCTRDSCIFKDGKPICEHRQIIPCTNNGICERGETSIIHSPCCPREACAETEVVVLSDDCPKTCDDGNPNTADWYEFDIQKCQHRECINPSQFTQYSEYGDYIKHNLRILLALEQGRVIQELFTYGGTEGVEQKITSNKVFFIMFEQGDWGSYHFWAVEVNRETGVLIKYQEVTKGKNEINYNALWW